LHPRLKLEEHVEVVLRPEFVHQLRQQDLNIREEHAVSCKNPPPVRPIKKLVPQPLWVVPEQLQCNVDHAHGAQQENVLLKACRALDGLKNSIEEVDCILQLLVTVFNGRVTGWQLYLHVSLHY
jgi:hypothetical protein